MSLQDEHDLPNDALNHDPTGGRKRDGLAINGDSGHPSTQVTANKLAHENYACVGYRMSHPFFLPTSSHAWHEGVPSFLCLGRGVRDVIVTTGGTQTPDMPGMKGDT